MRNGVNHIVSIRIYNNHIQQQSTILIFIASSWGEGDNCFLLESSQLLLKQC